MDKSQETPLTDRQRYWLEHIRACETSGKGVAEYAVAQGLDAKAMYAGKKVLVKKGIMPRTRRSRFQRAQVMAPVSDSAWCVQLPNGLLVVFSGTVDAKTLSTVLTTAAAVD